MAFTCHAFGIQKRNFKTHALGHDTANRGDCRASQGQGIAMRRAVFAGQFVGTRGVETVAIAGRLEGQAGGCRSANGGRGEAYSGRVELASTDRPVQPQFGQEQSPSVGNSEENSPASISSLGSSAENR